MRTSLNAGLCAFLVVAFIAGPFSTAAMAQTRTQIAQAQATGTLSGTVTDSRNAAVAGAVVVVRSPSGITQQTTTDDQGRFSVSVPPGLYDVIITKGGFQQNETDSVGVVAGSVSNLAISLTEIELSTLRVIGRVTSRATNTINNRPDAVATISSDDILARAQPNLNEQIGELPGVYISRGTGTTPNTNWVIRGQAVEAKTQIDGHPVSSGVFGEYTSQFANASIFQQAEVVKGGLAGPNSGESPVGTINLRTRDFTSTNRAYLSGGGDGYGGSYYNVWASGNALSNNKLSYVVAKSMSAYRGTGFGYFSNVINGAAVTPNTTYTINDSGAATSLVKWQGDMSYPFVLSAELAKVRYRFSEATSLSFEFLGMQGKWTSQGGSYASYSGYRTVVPCFTQTAPAAVPASGVYNTAVGSYASNANAAACNQFSQYNPPYVGQVINGQTTGLIGQNVPFYGWFPWSVVQNNEPYWSAEFRTSLKNDTILIRPYAALINRFISGAIENQYPGNNGGWFQVTSTANCQTQFVPPNSVTGATAKGPCFPASMAPSTTVPFVNPTSAVPVFKTTTSPYLTCSAAAPCYTTLTTQENDGLWGYGTPFSQPELDRLRGITFQYLHPVGSNLFGFSYDYNRDDTSKLTADTTIVPAGCTPTVAGNNQVANVPSAPGYQPTCPLPFLPGNDINIPSTQITHSDFALTGLMQLNPRLQAQLGLYVTTWNANYQIENQALVLALGSQAPVSFTKLSRSISHFDPQIGFTYRPTTDLILRASGGSGVTVPYAGQISGLANLTLANAANNFTYTYQTPNASLLPETTITYDLGGDLRLHDGGIASLDLFNNTTHNVFVTSTVPGTPATVPGCLSPPAVVCQTSTTFNGPIWRNYGVELTLQKVVPVGFGYTATTTLQRSFYDQLPAFIYTPGSNLINGKQLDGGPPFVKAYAEGRFGWGNGGRISFGGDWQGQNNQTYGPGFVTFNATGRVPISRGWYVQMAVDNLFNYNSGTFIGQGTFNNGQSVSRLQIVNGVPVYSSSATSVQTIAPRNARLELTRTIGY